MDRVAALPDFLDKVDPECMMTSAFWHCSFFVPHNRDYFAQVEAEQDVFVLAALYRALTFAASAYLLEPSHHEQARSGK